MIQYKFHIIKMIAQLIQITISILSCIASDVPDIYDDLPSHHDVDIFIPHGIRNDDGRKCSIHACHL
jgi:hypothetical protein